MQRKEEMRRKRVELDDQEKDLITRFITRALKTRQKVKLRMYDPFEDIYVLNNNDGVDLLLVLRDDNVDQLALGLVNLLNKVSKQYPDYNIDMDYTLADYFSVEDLPEDYVKVPRG